MHSSTAQHNTRTRATATARPLLTSGTTAGLRLCHRDCIRGSQMSVSTPASLLLRLHSCVATCGSRRRETAARTVAEATVSRPDSGGGHRQPPGQWRRPPSADLQGTGLARRPRPAKPRDDPADHGPGRVGAVSAATASASARWFRSWHASKPRWWWNTRWPAPSPAWPPTGHPCSPRRTASTVSSPIQCCIHTSEVL